MDFDRFDQMLAEGRLLRGQWTGTDEQGREMACALAALVPACGSEQTASACPAEDLPQWLAVLIPSLDDQISSGGWYDRMVRLGGALRLTVGWSPQQWRRCEARVHLAILAEARSHVAADYGHTLAAIDGVTALWRRVAAGDEPTQTAWKVASWTAASSRAASSWAAEAVAEAASRAAEAAEAEAGAEAAWAAAAWAAVEAWDRVCDGVIAALEAT